MTARMIRQVVAITVCAAALTNAGDAETPLRVAAAVSLREVLTTISADFEAQTGIRVELVFGSSGQLLAQIRNGAPIDLFISAAHEPVDVLEREGLLQPGPRRVVAGNKLVLVAPKGAPPPVKEFLELAQPAVRRLAMGEPSTVPAGQYAQQVLDKLGIADALIERIIYGTNVRQVLDYVARREVTLGIVYATDALARADEVIVTAIAEAAWHQPIEYPAVGLARSCRAADSERYIGWMTGETAAITWRERGFSVPLEPTTRPERPNALPAASDADPAARPHP